MDVLSSFRNPFTQRKVYRIKKKKLYVLKQYLRARLNDFLELCRDMDTDRLRVTKLDL